MEIKYSLLQEHQCTSTTLPAFVAPVGGDPRSNSVMIFGIRKRVMELSCGVVCVILRLAVLIQYRSVTDRQTHRQTDTHTDTRRRHIPRLARRRAVKKNCSLSIVLTAIDQKMQKS